jgi:hypothetical protein
MTDDVNAAAAGRRRGGRPRKVDKRLPVSLRITPELRGRLRAMAKENSRSITQQTELLLEQAINGGGLGVSPASVEKLHDHLSWIGSLEDEGKPPAGANPLQLFVVFDAKTIALLALIGLAMAKAGGKTFTWSHAAEWTQHLPAKKPGSPVTLQETEQLSACLRGESDLRFRFPSDAFAFGQAVDAARKVLETVAPEGDPTMLPPPPRGIDPLIAALVMRDLGAAAGEEILHSFIDEENRDPMSLAHREWLGEDVVARIRRRLSEEPAPEPTDG